MAEAMHTSPSAGTSTARGVDGMSSFLHSWYTAFDIADTPL
jgi:hypothetical protein